MIFHKNLDKTFFLFVTIHAFDTRTDGRTAFSWLDCTACNACSAVKRYLLNLLLLSDFIYHQCMYVQQCRLFLFILRSLFACLSFSVTSKQSCLVLLPKRYSLPAKRSQAGWAYCFSSVPVT